MENERYEPSLSNDHAHGNPAGNNWMGPWQWRLQEIDARYSFIVIFS
jgi:hypothetical protein